jgi:hypothetical protein
VGLGRGVGRCFPVVVVPVVVVAATQVVDMMTTSMGFWPSSLTAQHSRDRRGTAGRGNEGTHLLEHREQNEGGANDTKKPRKAKEKKTKTIMAKDGDDGVCRSR